MNSRTQQKTATRAALKSAARSCFARQGFAETGVGDIARAAGVAHGTYYVHFASKEALLDELLDDFNATLLRRLQPVLDGALSRPVRDSIVAAANGFLDHCDEQRAFVEYYSRRATAGLTLERARDGLNAPMLGVLTHALRAAGHLPHAELVAHGLLALWLRVGLQYLFNPQVTRRQASDTLVGMSLGAIGGMLAGTDLDE